MDDVQVLPQSVEYEQSLLGGLLQNDIVLGPVSAFLKPEHFIAEQHQKIYGVMIAMQERGDPVDLMTVDDHLQRTDNGYGWEEYVYLSALPGSCPCNCALHVVAHAKIIHRKARNRRLIEVAANLSDSGYRDVDDDSTAIASAESILSELSENHVDSESMSMRELLATFPDEVRAAIENRGRLTGVASGFPDLDEATVGFQPGDLIILAARPSMGKTALAGDIAAHAALKAKVPVGIFSIEMSSKQIRDRLVARSSGVSTQNLRKGDVDDRDWGNLMRVMDTLSDAPIYVEDPGSLNVGHFRARARRLVTQRKVGLLIVDYLQLMTGSKTENRVQEVSEISRTLKAIARDLNIPVIALSQLSRQPDLRPSHRPVLSDLRETGGLEQDADVVMMLYRDVVYDKETDSPNLAELNIAKQRNGPLGTVSLYFDAKLTTFRNWSHLEGEVAI